MKYMVSFPVICYVNVKVDAADEDEAIDLAYEDFGITAYCGNGGSDKLIGVYGSNVSIEASEEIAEGEFKLSIECEEIK